MREYFSAVDCIFYRRETSGNYRCPEQVNIDVENRTREIYVSHVHRERDASFLGGKRRGDSMLPRKRSKNVHASRLNDESEEAAANAKWESRIMGNGFFRVFFFSFFLPPPLPPPFVIRPLRICRSLEQAT